MMTLMIDMIFNHNFGYQLWSLAQGLTKASAFPGYVISTPVGPTSIKSLLHTTGMINLELIYRDRCR